MKNTKHFIALFYVTLFLLFKVAGLHAFIHNSDDTNIEHCEVCDISTTVNFTPLLLTEFPVLPQTEYHFSEPKFNNNIPFVVFNNKFLSSNLLTRPPPQLS